MAKSPTTKKPVKSTKTVEVNGQTVPKFVPSKAKQPLSEEQVGQAVLSLRKTGKSRKPVSDPTTEQIQIATSVSQPESSPAEVYATPTPVSEVTGKTTTSKVKQSPVKGWSVADLETSFSHLDIDKKGELVRGKPALTFLENPTHAVVILNNKEYYSGDIAKAVLPTAINVVECVVIHKNSRCVVLATPDRDGPFLVEDPQFLHSSRSEAEEFLKEWNHRNRVMTRLEDSVKSWNQLTAKRYAGSESEKIVVSYLRSVRFFDRVAVARQLGLEGTLKGELSVQIKTVVDLYNKTNKIARDGLRETAKKAREGLRKTMIGHGHDWTMFKRPLVLNKDTLTVSEVNPMTEEKAA